MRLFSLLTLASLTAVLVSASPHAKRDVVPVVGPYGWTDEGCYSNPKKGNVFTGPSFYSGKVMTQTTCVGFCRSRGFNVAGLHGGKECVCEADMPKSLVRQPTSRCDAPCPGDTTQLCGGKSHYNVFFRIDVEAITNPGPSGSEHVGCFTNFDTQRALLVQLPIKGQMTVDKCVQRCAKSHYGMAGVGMGGKCWCDNQVRPWALELAAGCNAECAGNYSEFCGGPLTANIYRLPKVPDGEATTGRYRKGWSDIGCWTDLASAPSLGGPWTVPGGPTAMTVESCMETCEQGGYNYAGLKFAQECYCGSAMTRHAVCSSDQGLCNMPCHGEQLQICGGLNTLSVYKFGEQADRTCIGHTGSTGMNGMGHMQSRPDQPDAPADDKVNNGIPGSFQPGQAPLMLVNGVLV